MKRSTLLYGSIVLALIILAVFYYFTNNKSTLTNRDKAFNIKDTSIITKIEICKYGESILLEKDSYSVWHVNNDFVAKKGTIDALLKVLMHLEIKSPVSKSMQESLLKKLKSSDFTISISGKKRLLKHIMLYEDSNTETTYMILEGAEQPFVMGLPGYYSKLGNLFVSDKNYWRENLIFNHNVRDILFLSVDYPSQSQFSYIIENQEEKFVLKSKFEDEPIENINLTGLLNYLYEYNDVRFEEFLISNIQDNERDSILNTDPLMIIQVKDIKNNIATLQGHPIPVENKYDELGNKIEYDLDMLYGLINGSDLVILSYFEIGALLKKINYFFNE